ncbi:hypothetical protein JTB14_010481 [Gonioctena quinquepunctata]|nr:hypothetical protein JTB14_010481 [Gonioctena quinquepunctata]
MSRSKSGVTRQGPSNVQVKKALAAVKDGMSQRKACEEFSVSRATLQRLLKRNETEVDNYKPYKNFTDREEPTGSTDDPKPSTSQHLVPLNDGDDNNALAMERTAPEFTTPEQLRPYPKAKTRTMKASNREKTKSRVLTDTPEKDEIERIFNERQRKEELKKSKQVVRNITARKKKVPVEVESSGDEETYSPDSDSSEISNEICEPEEQVFVCTSLKHGDYVLTKICGKKSIHFYVAEIINIVTNDEFQVKY